MLFLTVAIICFLSKTIEASDMARQISLAITTVRTKTANPPTTEVVADLYDKCVENLTLLNVPSEDKLLEIWQRFGRIGDYNLIQSWYNDRVRFCKALNLTDPAAIDRAFKAVYKCKGTIRRDDTTTTMETVRDLFKELVLDFKKSVPAVIALFSNHGHSYYDLEDVAKELRRKASEDAYIESYKSTADVPRSKGDQKTLLCQWSVCPSCTTINVPDQCEKCDGSGKVPDDGFFSSGEKACPDCGGEGRIAPRYCVACYRERSD